MLIQMVMILAFADPNAILPNELAWLDDPNILPTLFEQWNEIRPEPYLTVLVENWLRPNRWREYPRFGSSRWLAPYSWAGDLNHDEKMNIRDFGVAAKHYTVGLKLPPPKPAPPTHLENLARLAEIIFMEN